MKNYYKVLGVTQTATNGEIKEAYKRLLAHYDAQVNAGDRYAEERYIDIAVAYNTLINKDKRNDYDRILNSVLSVPQKRKIKKEKETPVVMPVPETVAVHTGTRRSYSRAYIAAFAVIVPLLIVWAAFFKSKNGDIPSSPQIAAALPPAIEKKAEPVVQKTLPAEMPVVAAAPVHVAEKQPEVQKTEPVAQIEGQTAEQEPEIAEEPAEIYPAAIAIGSPKTDVLKIKGTPLSITRFNDNSEVWQYDHSSIVFRSNIIISMKDRIAETALLGTHNN